MELLSATYNSAIDLLCQLIATPSVSRGEDAAADVVQQWLTERGIASHRLHNNVWAMCQNFDPAKPTLMLNSHIDTVKPSASYTFDPFTPERKDGRIYGLGSNDAGASVVSLAAVFGMLHTRRDLPVNLLLAFSAEEEVSGEKGMRALLPEFERLGMKIDMAIVGEPTSMQPAIAERGLMVLDCTSHGVSGHAARGEGVNALYRAIDDINVLRNLEFDRVSPTLGPIKLTVTQIQAGSQHNVVPDTCTFVADVRTTDAYSNEETAQIISNAIDADVKPRSYRIRASVIDSKHPLVRAAVALGKNTFISPTTSDMALMPFATLKIGPGDSARSHTADEYVFDSQIADAINTYHKIITSLTI